MSTASQLARAITALVSSFIEQTHAATRAELAAQTVREADVPASGYDTVAAPGARKARPRKGRKQKSPRASAASSLASALVEPPARLPHPPGERAGGGCPRTADVRADRADRADRFWGGQLPTASADPTTARASTCTAPATAEVAGDQDGAGVIAEGSIRAPRPCLGCRAPLPTHGLFARNRKFCTPECRKAATTKPVPPRACRICGSTFTPERRRAAARVCSDECRVLASRESSRRTNGRRIRHRRSEPRAHTLSLAKLTAEARAGEFIDLLTDDDEALLAERPRTRGDCVDGPRPCPWVACRAHLFLDVEHETGSIKFNFPNVEPWELAETCVLDLADQGGITLEDVGGVMNLTRERIRQVEVRGLVKLRAISPSPDELGAHLLSTAAAEAA